MFKIQSPFTNGKESESLEGYEQNDYSRFMVCLLICGLIGPRSTGLPRVGSWVRRRDFTTGPAKKGDLVLEVERCTLSAQGEDVETKILPRGREVSFRHRHKQLWYILSYWIIHVSFVFKKLLVPAQIIGNMRVMVTDPIVPVSPLQPLLFLFRLLSLLSSGLWRVCRRLHRPPLRPRLFEGPTTWPQVTLRRRPKVYSFTLRNDWNWRLTGNQKGRSSVPWIFDVTVL